MSGLFFSEVVAVKFFSVRAFVAAMLILSAPAVQTKFFPFMLPVNSTENQLLFN